MRERERVVTVVVVVYEVMVAGVKGEGDIGFREKEKIEKEH